MRAAGTPFITRHSSPLITKNMVVAILALASAARLPQCSTALTPSAHALPRGVVSVVTYGADPTGSTDSTLSLQSALTAARTQNVTLFVPFGCYVVSDTLTATQARNGRWQPVVIVGQIPGHGWEHRPTLVLPARTRGFGEEEAKPLLLFITNWCLEPGASADETALGCESTAQPQRDWHSSAYQFNQVLQGVDIWLGEGNPSAVGIDQNGAQWTTLEDVAVYAGRDALAGIAGGNGGGGSYKNVTVVGAKYGIDSRRTGSAPTFVAITLLNQSCAGFLHGSHSTMIATGLRIEGSPAIAGIVGGIDAKVFGVPGCETPPAPGGPNLWDATGSADTASLHSALSIIDSYVCLGRSASKAPCVVANSSIYLSNVFTCGCDTAIESGGRPPVASAEARYTHFPRVGFGRLRAHTDIVPGDLDYEYAFPSYVDGER